MPSQIAWAAVYNDNKTLPQYEQDGTEHSTEEIDRKKLRSMTIFYRGKPIIKQTFDPGQRLIFRRRVTMVPGQAEDGSEDTRDYVYLLGWQQKVGGKNVQHVAYIFESTGMIEMAGKFLQKHPYDEPVFLPCEEQETE